MDASGRPAAARQAERVRAAESARSKEKLVYLVTADWWRAWAAHVGYGGSDAGVGARGDGSTASANGRAPEPGPIDQESILEPGGDGALRSGLKEGEHYVVLSQMSWEAVSEWYGGGPAVPRRVAYVGYLGTREVEVYPLVVDVFRIDSATGEPEASGRAESATVPRDASAGDLAGIAREAVGAAAGSEVRLWVVRDGKVSTRIAQGTTVLPTPVRLGSGVAVETKDASGAWPRDLRADHAPDDPQSFAATSLLSRGRRSSSASALPTLPDGCVGLRNLGNTCFMNSALQCLSNMQHLTKYFLNQDYVNDINKENVLGHGGELANAYANLVKQLWGGAAGGSSVSPYEIKYLIGRRREEFRGYAQQDSQELLAFLLDGLHEDLNRVRVRPPYKEDPDDDGAPPRPDGEAAADAWEDYASRNSSVVVDLMQGQIKSRVVCPNCGHTSITFDPVMYLSLPLPGRGRRTLPLVLVRLSGRPIRMRVSLSRGANAEDVLTAAAQMAGMAPTVPLVVAEVRAGRLQRTLAPGAPVEGFFDPNHGGAGLAAEPSLYVYELKHVPPTAKKRASFGSTMWAFCAPIASASGQPHEGAPGGVIVAVHQRVHTEPSEPGGASSPGVVSWMFSSGSGAGPEKVVGYPLLICLSADGLTSASVAREARQAVDNALSCAAAGRPGQQGGAPAEDAMEVDGVAAVGAHADAQMSEDACASEGKLMLCARSGGDRGTPFPEEDESGAPTISDTQALVLEWPESCARAVEPLSAASFDEHSSWAVEKVTDGGSLRLEDVLQAYTREEKLGKENMWRCPKCKAPREATKQLSLWRAPKVLCLHLKRFSSGRYMRDKLDTFVQYPLTGLSLSDVMAAGAQHPGAKYSLFAVSCHMGGLGGGHYTAYGKNAVDGEWYYYNDESVSRASEKEAVTRKAYLLFYQLDA